MNVFNDRRDAGRQLAKAVAGLRLADPTVIALPRGGVPVAAEVARALHAPLDVIIVRKIGAPGQPELAIAAVAEGRPPTVLADPRACSFAGVDEAYIEARAREERPELERRCSVYRRDRPPTPIAGKDVVLVDDGIATGMTVRAALQLIRAMKPARLVLAVPVSAEDTLAELRPLVDDLVCLLTPAFFGSVGTYYHDFDQVGDDEVVQTLEEAREQHASQARG